MTKQMPANLRTEIFVSLARRLDPYMDGRVYPEEIATTFNYVLRDEFSKPRGIPSDGHNLHPVFVGEYRVDPANPEQTRVFSHQGSEACSPIPITKGVIGRAIRTGEDQYVPDVTQVADHVGCDPTMEGSELVLITFSEPYTSGPHKGKSVPVGVLDIDLQMKDALGIIARGALRHMWDTYGPLIFPGEAQFQPGENMYVGFP